MVTQTDRGRGLTGQLGVKAPVVVATTAAITLVGTQTIDGVALAVEDRVLVKDQTDTKTNGIYICQLTAWLRAPDFDGDRDLLQGTWVPAALGSTNLGSIFRVTSANPIVIGTSAITFAVATTTGAVSTAAASASTASTQASNASSSASAASTSASNASGSASTASTQASNASGSASTASTQASNASSSASTASTQASNASSSASAASSSAAAAAASYDSFDDRYLGAKGSGAPSTDNDGDTLVTGALYWDSGTNLMMVWDGSAWVDAAGGESQSHTEAAHATTSDIWSGGDTCLLSGSAVTFTDVADAPQAGASRMVVANAAHIFTDNSNLEVDGNSNYTCAIGDLLRFEAKTTSTFRVSVVAHGDGAGSGDAKTANPLSQFAATSSAQLKGVISDETGSGALAFATSPTLVTPALGTPASGVATNLTGTAASLTSGNVTTNANLTGHITSSGNAAVLGSFSSAQLKTALTDETGSGTAVFATAPTIVGLTATGDITMTGKSINGATHTEAAHATTSDIWTGGNTCLLSGSAVTFTDVADAPQAGAIRHVVANAAHVITDNAALEMDGNANYTCAANDVLMFTAKTTSTFRVNVLAHGDSATGGGDALTSNPLSQFAATSSAQLRGVLSDETGSGVAVFATSPTLVTPALGTPASGVVTNLTGTASININGTVGAGTPTTAAVTTLTATGDITLTGKSVNAAVHTEAAHATTSDIWTGGNTCLLSGSVVTFTDIANAPVAGSIRHVVANAAHVFTDNAALEVDGNANYTCAANDVLMITAKTTSTFRVNVLAHGDSSSGGGGSGGESGLLANSATVATNYSLASGSNAVSAGPITINSGITVTIPTGSRWAIV